MEDCEFTVLTDQRNNTHPKLSNSTGCSNGYRLQLTKSKKTSKKKSRKSEDFASKKSENLLSNNSHGSDWSNRNNSVGWKRPDGGRWSMNTCCSGHNSKIGLPTKSYSSSICESRYGSSRRDGNCANRGSICCSSRTSSSILTCLLVLFALFAMTLTTLLIYTLIVRHVNSFRTDCVKVSGSMLEKLNTSVDPCDDFYEYACGSWIQNARIPYLMLQWNEIYRIGMDAYTTVRRRFEDAAKEKQTELNKAQRKAQILYQSCMNDQTLQNVGTEPMLEFVRELGGWPLANQSDEPVRSLEDTMTSLYEHGYYPLVWVGVTLDERNTSRYILTIDQPVLSLHQLDNYSPILAEDLLSGNASESMQQLFDFVYFTARDLFDAPDNERLNRSVAELVEFEAKMAMLMMSEMEKRDPFKTYYLTNLEDLQSSAPFINWLYYLSSILPEENITKREPMVIKGIDWIGNLSRLIVQYRSTEQGSKIVENYAKWRAIMHQFAYLGQTCATFPPSIKSYVHAMLMTGIRWIFCLTRTMQVMTVPVASLFVQLQPQAPLIRERVINITQSVASVLRDEVSANHWMDNATKQTAIAKVEQIFPLIAYPDNLDDRDAMESEFESLDIKAGEFFWNMVKGMRFVKRQETGHLRQVPDRTKWTTDSSPMKINAYYTFERNIIVVPAAILSPPLFNVHAPDAVNFASIGSIVGHELTHAFDNRGRHYDENGNLREWWSKEAMEHYRTRTQCLVDQYSNYSVHGHSIDGEKTLSENIADNVGLRLAYNAWMAHDRIDRQKRFPGLNMTGEQAFFLGYAQTWCAKITEHFQILQVYQQVHVTEKLRVLVPLRNMPEFGKAFNCPVGSPMVPEKNCDPF